MIYVTLAGGIGNQMFQYATGRCLADRLCTELTMDISGYTNHSHEVTARDYELGAFSVRANLDARKHTFSRLVGRLPANLASALGAPAQLKEQSFSFDARVLSAKDGTSLHGYWQSELYFSDIRTQLLNDFSFIGAPDAKNTSMAKSIKSVNAVSLHVRRGDYVTNPRHGTKSLEYYSAAIQLLLTKVPEPHFFVFSDDPSWCKANLRIRPPATYVDHNNANFGYKDLALMSQCQHHIIANSSFSWWGAWLNPRLDKLVIAPQRWFNDPNIVTDDLYPSGWIKI